MKLKTTLTALIACARLIAQDAPPADTPAEPLPIPAPPTSVTFSFASDDHHAGPTFTVFSGNRIASKAAVNLMVDLNNHLTGGQVTFQAVMIFEGELSKHQVCSVSLPYGVAYTHTWVIKPTTLRFEHIAPGTALLPGLLDIQTQVLVLQAVSSSPNFIMDAANITIHERISPNMVLVPGPRMQGIGVFPTSIQYNEDVAFTLTNIKQATATGGYVSAPIMIDSATGNFLSNFVAEGSFSASADGF